MNNKTQLVDINIANILGIKQPEIVFLIRTLLESYSWFLDQTVGETSKIHIERYEKSNGDNRDEACLKGNSNLDRKFTILNKKTVDTKNKKKEIEDKQGEEYDEKLNKREKESKQVEKCSSEVNIEKAALIITEYGVKDYSVEEISMYL